MKKREWLVLAAWLALVFVCRYLKFGMVIGEQSVRLVSFAAVLPTVGFFFSGRRVLGWMLGGWLLTHLVHPMPLTAGIPTFLAMLSYRASARGGMADRVMHGAFPLLAMALFILSPHGAGAWPYTLYWLIPVGLMFVGGNLFVRALQSTFVAHAVGSVMWAYLTGVSSAGWLALIPVVAIERLLAAGLAVGVIGTLAAMGGRRAEAVEDALMMRPYAE